MFNCQVSVTVNSLLEFDQLQSATILRLTGWLSSTIGTVKPVHKDHLTDQQDMVLNYRRSYNIQVQ